MVIHFLQQTSPPVAPVFHEVEISHWFFFELVKCILLLSSLTGDSWPETEWESEQWRWVWRTRVLLLWWGFTKICGNCWIMAVRKQANTGRVMDGNAAVSVPAVVCTIWRFPHCHNITPTHFVFRYYTFECDLAKFGVSIRQSAHPVRETRQWGSARLAVEGDHCVFCVFVGVYCCYTLWLKWCPPLIELFSAFNRSDGPTKQLGKRSFKWQW